MSRACARDFTPCVAVFCAVLFFRAAGLCAGPGPEDIRDPFVREISLGIDRSIGGFSQEPYQETNRLEPVEQRWRDLGFIPFVRAWGTPVYPNTVPAPMERGASLAAFAAPGEDEPLLLGVRTLDRGIQGLTVTVGDLICLDTTGFIPAGAVETGVVEYFRVRWGQGSSDKKWRWHPTRIWPLEHYPGSPFCRADSADLLWVAPQTAQAFWLTVHTPSGATPGKYLGAVTLSTFDGRYDFSLVFTVLPLPLEKQGLPPQGVLMSGPQDMPACRDLALHGVNAASQWYSPAQMPVSFERGVPEIDFGLQDAFMSRLRSAGLDGPHIIFGGGASDPAFDRALAPLAGTETDSIAFLNAYAAAVQKIFEHGRREGWNHLVWAVSDNPGQDRQSLERFAYRVEVLRRLAGPLVTILMPHPETAPREAENLAPDIDCWLADRNFESIRALALNRKPRASVWEYATCNQRNSGAESRYKVGFGAWRDGLDGVYVWAYNWVGGGHPWNDFDAPVMDWMVSYRDLDDRYLPTPAWEGFREGVEDRRYLLTLQKLILSRPPGDTLAQEAEQALEIIRRGFEGPVLGLENLDLPQDAPPGSDNSPMGRARRLLAAHILRLARK